MAMFLIYTIICSNIDDHDDVNDDDDDHHSRSIDNWCVTLLRSIAYLAVLSYIAPSCSGSGLGSFFSISGSASWTQYSNSYTATNPVHVPQFTVHGGGASETVYLDDISVVRDSLPTIQLLSNPSFENSTSGPTAWSIWCTSYCAGSGDGGRISTSGCHPGSGNNCYMDHCKTGYDLLGQSFSTEVGESYTISFWYFKTGGGAGKLFVDIH